MSWQKLNSLCKLQTLVQKRHGGIDGKLTENREYTYKACAEEINSPESCIAQVNLDGAEVEVIDPFCYLGDTISTQKLKIPFTTKDRLYQACVVRSVLYGSKTWPVRAEELQCVERNDMRMMRWICNISLRERISSEELRRRLRLKSIGTC